MRQQDVGDRRVNPARRERYKSKLTERPLQGEEALVEDDQAALDHLRRYLWPDGVQFCPRCKEDKLYTLSGGRYRCSTCKYTFTELSCRWINSGGMPLSDWVFLARLFVEDCSAQAMADEMGLSYNTVYKALTALRFSLMGMALDAKAMFGHETGLSKYVRNRRLISAPKTGRVETIPVFGIMEKDGWVFVDLMPHFQAENVFHFSLNFHLPLRKIGNIVYSDRYRLYDAMVLCGDDSLPMASIRNPRSKTYIDRVECGFWPFFRHRIKNYKGITPARFPLYLKELEFRYNHRDQDLMPLVLESLCSLVPDIE